MLRKNVATEGHRTAPSSQERRRNEPTCTRTQRGVTLIELLVGLVIGLLTIAVAMGALMVSREVSGTVSDASKIQQQAAYAMRVIGMQVRQAGSLRLNLNPGTSTAAEPYLAAVGFETTIPPASSPLEAFDPAQNTIKGTATPVTLTVGFRRYTEPVFTSAAEQSLSRNCLGGPADGPTITDQRIESIFELNGSDLRCSGNGATFQPIIQNVATFQVRYLTQDNTTTPGRSSIKSVDAGGVINWAQVQAVEVCLVLYGDERIDLPAGSNYTSCDGTVVDMSTLTGVRARRMHIPFRSTFQLRSQGLVGSVL